MDMLGFETLGALIGAFFDRSEWMCAISLFPDHHEVTFLASSAP